METPRRWILTDADSDSLADGLCLDGDDVRGTPNGWRVRFRRLKAGLSAGVDQVDVDLGGFRFGVIPTRGMALWKVWNGGREIGWNAPIRGPVHPGFVPLLEPGGLGFLDGPTELMFRCGLESNGAPEFDPSGRLRFPLHGRITNLPAYRVELEVDSTGITLRGFVEECRLLGQKLQLASEYRALFGASGLTWTDRVANIGGRPASMQMLYHTNIGEPFLEPGATLMAPVATVCPRDAMAARAGVSRWATYPERRAGSQEQVYFLELIGDEDQNTEVLLLSAERTGGVGLRFNRRELPCFTQWRNTEASVDGYVTGLEPGTNFPNPRSFEEGHDRLVRLEPGADWTATVALDLHADAESLGNAQERIARLQSRRACEILETPRPDWCPAV